MQLESGQGFAAGQGMYGDPPAAGNGALTQHERFLSIVKAERRRLTVRLYSACFLAVLIGVVVYQTQWFSLRYGLSVLLVGQVCDVVALVAQLLRRLNETSFPRWFEIEEQFIRRLALFDAVCQMIGFLALGYAFWISTGSLLVSLGIGIAYPVTMYFGMNRRKTAAAIKQLIAQRHSL